MARTGEIPGDGLADLDGEFSRLEHERIVRTGDHIRVDWRIRASGGRWCRTAHYETARDNPEDVSASEGGDVVHSKSGRLIAVSWWLASGYKAATSLFMATRAIIPIEASSKIPQRKATRPSISETNATARKFSGSNHWTGINVQTTRLRRDPET